MKRLLLLVLIFTHGIINLFSQSDFRNGYIINNNNDTIYGLIDYRGDKANSKKCIFKKEANSEKQEFTPDDIKAYRFTDSKYFISKTIKLNGKETSCFLEYLINGIVNVFYYYDSFGQHYLMYDSEGNLYELKNEQREVYVNGTKYLKSSNEYIGKLKYVFRKSPTIVKKVDNVSLDNKSLIKIARDYHNEVCSDKECIVYEKKLPKTIIKFGPLIGLNAMSISQGGNFKDDLYFLQNSHISSVIYPSIGIFFKINLPNVNEKLYFQYEGTLSYIKLRTFNSYNDPLYNMNYINNLSLANNVFSNSGILRYEFPKGKVRPTFQIGCFANYSFNIDYRRDLEVKLPWGDTAYTQNNSENPFSTLDIGINFGLGIIMEIFNRKQISFDLKYHRGSGLIQDLNSNTLLLNIGFNIGK